MSGALVKIEGAFAETAIEGEVVVMNLKSGEFFSLVDTAAAAWALIDGARDRTALVDALARDYAVLTQDIAAEIDAFLEQLVAAGLVGEA